MQISSDKSRDRFLDCAERQFVELGYRGTTIRAICKDAGTSLAILHRNWTDKEALFSEMLGRRFVPLHEQQNAKFDIIETASDLSLESVLTAFLQPAMAEIGRNADIGTFVYSRALIDPAPEIKSIVSNLIGPTRNRLIGLIKRACHCDDMKALYTAMSAIFGVYVYPQAFGGQLAKAMEIDESTIDWGVQSSLLVEILCSGLRSLKSPLDSPQTSAVIATQ